MENYKLKQLYYHYRATEGAHTEKCNKSFDKFENKLKEYVKNEKQRDKLSEAALYIENVASEQSFKAGYKCALQTVLSQVMKECGLL